jgi:hypothetical protein
MLVCKVKATHCELREYIIERYFGKEADSLQRIRLSVDHFEIAYSKQLPSPVTVAGATWMAILSLSKAL